MRFSAEQSEHPEGMADGSAPAKPDSLSLGAQMRFSAEQSEHPEGMLTSFGAFMRFSAEQSEHPDRDGMAGVL